MRGRDCPINPPPPSAWRIRLPLVLVVCGLPASGKTHLAVALTGAMGLPRISADVIRMELAGIDPAHLTRGEHYTETFHRAVYAELGRRAARHAEGRGGVVVDGSFSRRTMRDAFAGALDGGVPVLFAECTAPPEVLAQRAAARSMRSRISPATLELVLRERARWEVLDEIAREARITLQTDRDSEAIMSELVASLDTRLRRASRGG